VVVRSLNHQATVRQWRELIAECRSSGKSVKDWCEENTINPSKYYYWLRTIRNESLMLA
jgi:transposase-like protein